MSRRLSLVTPSRRRAGRPGVPPVLSAVVLAVVALSAAGCGLVPDGALAAHDAQANGQVVQAAAVRAATLDVQAVQREAQAYVTLHGSVAGFAATLQASEPVLAARFTVLTDGSVSERVPGVAGRCVSAALPAGPASVTSC